MESRHQKRKCVLSVTCILFILAVLKQCEAAEVQNNIEKSVSCADDEYPHNGYCCNKCSPGYKLKHKCSESGRRSICEKCSNGTYQDNINYFPNCFMCTTCDSHPMEIETVPCEHNQNRQCGCQKGYYQTILNPITTSCEPCRKCGSGEIETHQCEGTNDAQCECKHNYYRGHTKDCVPCTDCRPECEHLCQVDEKPTVKSEQPPGHPLQTAVIVLAVFLCVTASVIVVILLYFGVKHSEKIKKALYSRSTTSCDPEQQVGKQEIHTICIESKEEESRLLQAQPEATQLPDCVPREIKSHDFIYFMINIVPISRFKELVRRLNVSEQDIGRAERDNRGFGDAQYQMLMTWVESGSKGGKNVLSLTLLQECMDRLKEMNLIACAESIEEKYSRTFTCGT